MVEYEVSSDWVWWDWCIKRGEHLKWVIEVHWEGKEVSTSSVLRRVSKWVLEMYWEGWVQHAVGLKLTWVQDGERRAGEWSADSHLCRRLLLSEHQHTAQRHGRFQPPWQVQHLPALFSSNMGLWEAWDTGSNEKLNCCPHPLWCLSHWAELQRLESRHKKLPYNTAPDVRSLHDDCSRKHGLSNASSLRVCYSNHPSWIKGADLLDPPTLLQSLPPKFEAVQLSCQAEDEVHCRQRVGKTMFVATAWPKSDSHTRKDAAHAVWSCLLYAHSHTLRGASRVAIMGELILKEYFNIFKALLAQNTWGSDT